MTRHSVKLPAPIKMGLWPLALAALIGCGGPVSPTLSITPEPPTSADDLALIITAAPETEPDVTYQVSWFRDGIVVTSLDSATTVPADETAKGEQWRAQVLAVDGKDRLSQAAEIVVTVVNSAPTVAVSISPESPRTHEDLVATVVGEDTDGDEVSFSLTWLRDGEDAGEQGATVSADKTASGEVWSLQVVPSDGESEGELAEVSVSIDNTAPVPVSVEIAPTEIFETSTVVASAEATDADGHEVSWRFDWYVGGVAVADEHGPELGGDHFNKHDTLRVEATPSDGFADGETIATKDVEVLNTLPTLEKATIDPPSAVETTTLSCIAQGWADADGDPASHRIAWTVNGEVASSAETLDGTDFNKGDEIRCNLTPWDGEAEGPVTTSSPMVIGNTAPVITSVAVDPAVLYTRTNATAVVVHSDVDDEELSELYAWYVNGKTAGFDDATLNASEFVKGDDVHFDLTVDDGTDSVKMTSAVATVKNTLPTAPTVEITPAVPRDEHDITCKIAAESDDDDDDDLSYDIDWYLGGKLWTGGTTKTVHAGDTVPAADTSIGQEWQCIVAAHDGDAYGPDGTSAKAKILGNLYVFTDCGRSVSQVGPSLAACRASYSTTNLNGKVDVVSGIQSWEVPKSGTYKITAWGAKGGGALGGYGAVMIGEFTLKAADELQILVGLRGGVSNQGGLGLYAAGGGGGTFVYTDAYSRYPLIAAAGGGGQSQWGIFGRAWGGKGSSTATTLRGNGTGSNVGGTSGAGGLAGLNLYSYSTGAGGGGWAGNGSNGVTVREKGGDGGQSPRNGAAGGSFNHSRYVNANGGFGGGGGASDNTGAGGGGGGYNGGGGGNNYSGSSRWGSGGGGGSYNGGAKQVNTTGARNGTGLVSIEQIK